MEAGTVFELPVPSTSSWAVVLPKDSMSFLALSQAPPALAMKMARAKPEVRPPASMPMTPGTPSTRPMRIGTMMARQAGMTISFWAAPVEMETQLA